MQKYLTTRQVAEVFHVHPNTVVVWANEGRLPVVRTAGGHRRFDPAEVEALREKVQSAGAA
jgi:excisionase family DNA binding protein